MIIEIKYSLLNLWLQERTNKYYRYVDETNVDIEGVTMKNNLQNNRAGKICPVRNVLDLFGDKWSILIIILLSKVEKLRFNELQKEIGDVSQKMLTATLRKLEGNDLIHRQVFPEIPPKVEYQITDRGKTLLPHVQGLIQWSEVNLTGRH